jgi:DNA-binding NarL/FixJ family response regulator
MSTSNAPRLTLLLADPNDVSRMGLWTVLEADGRFTVVGDTGRLPGVPRLAARLRPNLILLDPDVAGHLDTGSIGALARDAPESRICVRTAVFEPRSFLDALLGGAQAYLLKGSGNTAMLAGALALVGRHNVVVVDPAIADPFRAAAVGKLAFYRSSGSAEPLSEREGQVLRLLAAGSSDKEMAATLAIDDTTVRTYVRRLRAKLGAETRAQLSVLAARQGLLDG